MQAFFKSLINRLYVSIEQSAQLFEPRIFAFSIAVTVLFPVYYLIWLIFFPQNYENSTLRLIAGAIFIPLLLLKYWPKSIRKLFPIYWYFAIIYAFPFFFAFMLFNNNGSTVWLLSVLIAIFLVITLFDWLGALIQCVLGVGAAWVAYYMTTDLTPEDFMPYEVVPVYFLAIIIAAIANHSSEILQQQERLRVMLNATSNIAHELRTPLLGIKTGAAGLRHYLPVLLETYRIACEQGLIKKPIRLAHLSLMGGVLERIENEADHSNVIIDMLLSNTRMHSFQSENFSACSMVGCLEKALKRYPFASKKEMELVNVSYENDFIFDGIEILMIHILFNLMKNSFYHIAKANKGEIFIVLKNIDHENILYFSDTGPGVPPEILPNIFTCFYSWPQNNDSAIGAGIGLSFCQKVMKTFGGDIVCRSEHGVYTEFALIFPATEKNI